MTSREDDGFTLVELLVVMVVIGILAAIAIPSFASQRSKAYEAAIKSDLKQASIAEESYATDNNGAYTTAAVALAAVGYRPSAGVTVAANLYAAVLPGDSYCLTGTSTSSPRIWYLDSQVGKATLVKPAGC